MKKFTWQARVYYEDTDAGGVVYHACYLNFYERARTEMLRSMAINQNNLLQENIAFVVKQMAIDYIAIARLDELLTIHTRVLFFKKASLTCKQRIVNQSGKLINQANVVIACIDIAKMKPVVFPLKYSHGVYVVHMNIVDLFLKAGILVQCVMLLLFVFSVMSWAIIIQKNKALKVANRQMEEFDEKFFHSNELKQLYDNCTKNKNHLTGTALIFYSGFEEFSKLYKINPDMPTSALDGALRVMRLSMNREIDTLDTHIPFLGTVGSISPYIGLFGTVWGIMHAFISLGSAKQATLQMVAPGIAEALVATAIGLFAAIPAVMAYNRFTVLINRIDQEYLNFIDEVTAIMQRQAVAVRK